MIEIMGMGGPTGISMNPARDLGPRLAHWIMPIPGKGSSEWKYALNINLAAMIGGVAGGLIFAATKPLASPFSREIAII
jgi:glycerol uptake facilitator protein